MLGLARKVALSSVTKIPILLVSWVQTASASIVKEFTSACAMLAAEKDGAILLDPLCDLDLRGL